MTVAFDGYTATPAVVSKLSRSAPGKSAKGHVQVTRFLPGVFRGEAEALIQGFSDEQDVSLADTDTWSRSFTLDRTTPRAEFHLKMTKKIANLFTDCAVNILDADGKAVHAAGFDGQVVDMGVSLPQGQEKATYSLQVVGAFAMPGDMAAWGFSCRERDFLATPVGGKVSGPMDPLRLYAGVPANLDLSFAGDWPEAPGDRKIFGVVRFKDPDAKPHAASGPGPVVLEVPILLD